MNSSQDPEISDRSLLRRFRVGEQDAATRLYVKYAKRLHGLAAKQSGADLKSRLDPEDIVQSVFRTFFRRAREGHYDVPDGEELWKLFLVIGLHKIRDAATFHRAARRNVTRSKSIEEEQSPQLAAADDSIAESTLKLVIDELLESHTASQKQIILLRLDGYQVDEIATATARSRRTVERTLQKFRDQLRQTLGVEETSSE